MSFYPIFSFFGTKVIDKRTMNLFEGCKYFRFSNFICWIEKNKPGLSKSDSSWDNSYCVRLVIVSLDVDVGMLQFFVSVDSFFVLSI